MEIDMMPLWVLSIITVVGVLIAGAGIWYGAVYVPNHATTPLNRRQTMIAVPLMLGGFLVTLVAGTPFIHGIAAL